MRETVTTAAAVHISPACRLRALASACSYLFFQNEPSYSYSVFHTETTRSCVVPYQKRRAHSVRGTLSPMPCHQHAQHMLESPPFRPPLAMLELLGSTLASKDVVDLRPTRDAAACLGARVSSLIALVHSDNETVCEALEQHATGEFQQPIRHADQPAHNVSALCHRDFHLQSHLPGDADVFLWWQAQRFWSTHPILAYLRKSAAEGHLTRPKAAAIIMFDMTNWRDAGEWQALKRNATWWHEVAFDERSQCMATAPERHRPICSARACGTWLAASFPLRATDSPAAKDMVDHNHGALGVAGHVATHPGCA